MSDTAKPVGRPLEYTPAVGDAICEEIMDGVSLRTICSDESMPGRSTVFRWLAAIPEFQDQYARARDVQAETLADEIIEISDDGTNDWMEKFGREGESLGWQLNGEHVQRSKLRIDTRKWAASKLKPKKYGDAVKVSGDKDNPLVPKADLSLLSPAMFNELLTISQRIASDSAASVDAAGDDQG